MKFKKVIALILAVISLSSAFALTVCAAEEETQNTEIVETADPAPAPKAGKTGLKNSEKKGTAGLKNGLKDGLKNGEKKSA